MEAKFTGASFLVNFGNKHNNRFIENFSSQKFVHCINSDLKGNERTVVGFACGRTFEEATANAGIFAQAGTIASQTGLSPDEVLEQRNELLKALIFAKGIIERLSDDFSNVIEGAIKKSDRGVIYEENL